MGVNPSCVRGKSVCTQVSHKWHTCLKPPNHSTCCVTITASLYHKCLICFCLSRRSKVLPLLSTPLLGAWNLRAWLSKGKSHQRWSHKFFAMLFQTLRPTKYPHQIGANPENLDLVSSFKGAQTMKCKLWTETPEFWRRKVPNSRFALHGLAPP